MATSASPLRFHWSLHGTGVRDHLRGTVPRNQVNPVAELPEQQAFCQRAEEVGIDPVLLPIGFQRADPVTLTGVFGAATRDLTLMVAARSGIVSPTYFVQQINAVAAVTGGRVSINVVLGHSAEELRYYGDFLEHDERYRAPTSFWTICDALWRQEFPVNFAGEFLRVEGAGINNQFVSPNGASPRSTSPAVPSRPRSQTMIFFGEEIMPRIRQRVDDESARPSAQTEAVSAAGKEDGHG